MADLATLRARLTEAEAALHELRTKGAVTRVRTRSSEVERAAVSSASLEDYIQRLRREIAMLECRKPRSRVMRVRYGG